jgi:hypothetical protein
MDRRKGVKIGQNTVFLAIEVPTGGAIRESRTPVIVAKKGRER